MLRRINVRKPYSSLPNTGENNAISQDEQFIIW